jgi:hypothetical protein
MPDLAVEDNTRTQVGPSTMAVGAVECQTVRPG